MRRMALAALAAAYLVGALAAAAPKSVSFDGPEDVIDLKDTLSAYKPQPGAKPDGGGLVQLHGRQPVERSGDPRSCMRASRRISASTFCRGDQAQHPAGREHRSQRPRPTRQRLWTPCLPGDASAGTTASLAVRVVGAQSPPSLLAWTEPALAAHNRQLAIFVAAVAALIAAAAAIAAGLAVMTRHDPPRWAALTLLLMLLARLSESGMFDGSLVTSVGGPYGLIALFAGLTLAAGARLVDMIVPLKEAWPRGAGAGSIAA